MYFEGIHCFDTASVRFAFYPNGDDDARILGEISEATLRDVWGARRCDQGLIEVCERNVEAIMAKAIARYRAAPGTPVVLLPADFAILPMTIAVGTAPPPSRPTLHLHKKPLALP